MKSKPEAAEKIDAFAELVKELCKQVEGMTSRQKEELRAELYEYYFPRESPHWLN